MHISQLNNKMSFSEIVQALALLNDYPEISEYIKTYNNSGGFMFGRETDPIRIELHNRMESLLDDGHHSGSSWGWTLRNIQAVLNGTFSREQLMEAYENEKKENELYRIQRSVEDKLTEELSKANAVGANAEEGASAETVGANAEEANAEEASAEVAEDTIEVLSAKLEEITSEQNSDANYFRWNSLLVLEKYDLWKNNPDEFFPMLGSVCMFNIRKRNISVKLYNLKFPSTSLN